MEPAHSYDANWANLRRHPPASAELRDTVAAHIARNTVAYRVKKFEEVDGRSVGERRLELEAALRFAAFLGHDALGADAPEK